MTPEKIRALHNVLDKFDLANGASIVLTDEEETLRCELIDLEYLSTKNEVTIGGMYWLHGHRNNAAGDQ